MNWIVLAAIDARCNYAYTQATTSVRTEYLFGGMRVGSGVLRDAGPSRAGRFQISSVAAKFACAIFFGGLWWFFAGMIELPWWMRVATLALPLAALFALADSQE